jgi:ribonuclease H / adenosylcobalamin/alpha-ribazole phosphatase
MKRKYNLLMSLLSIFCTTKELNSAHVFVLRHAQAMHNIKRLMSSTCAETVTLTDTGIQQAEESAEKLVKEEPIHYIFSSPLKRTKQTAAIFAKHAGIPEEAIIIDERLREQYFGSYEGKTYPEYVAQFKNSEDEFILGAPDGESGNDVYARVANFFQEIENNPKYQGKNILIVTHAYTVCQTSKYFTGKRQELPGNAQWVKFTTDTKPLLSSN